MPQPGYEERLWHDHDADLGLWGVMVALLHHLITPVSDREAWVMETCAPCWPIMHQSGQQGLHVYCRPVRHKESKLGRQ